MPRSVLILSLVGIATVIAILAGGESDPKRAPYTLDQQLVVASFELDVERVKELLEKGANVNARLQLYDQELFRDRWFLGYSPIGSDKWTPLLAVANSKEAPDPRVQTENTTEGLEKAQKEYNKLDPGMIKERNKRRVEIARLLIAKKANLDCDDGYGSTALAAAVYLGYEELALLLIESGAELNTKTGIYIDGTGDISPLHRSTNNPRILKAMLERGAKLAVRDDSGQTPLHWAVRDSPESVRLLIEAGADVNAKDNEGRTPLSLVRVFEPPPGLSEKDRELFEQALGAPPQAKHIAELLKKAGGK